MNIVKSIVSDVKNNSAHTLDYLLKDSVEETVSEKGIKVRKVVSPFMRFVYRFQSDYKFVLDGREELEKTEKGKIFVVNHRQSDDMVFSAITVGESGYFVFGNKILALDSLSNGFGLWSYGMIILDRSNKENRQATYEKMKYVIEHGGNIIIFPEGYWNLADNGLSDSRHNADDHNSESWLIQDINTGVVRLAQETGCQIVPSILHYDEFGTKMCYGKRGKAITVSKEDDILTKKDEVVSSMTNIYWSLMEKYSNYSVNGGRKMLEENGMTVKEQWEALKAKLVSDCDIDRVSYKLDLQDEKKIGKAKVVKNITVNEEAFKHLNEIEYNENNAFLLSKHLKGRR